MRREEQGQVVPSWTQWWLWQPCGLLPITTSVRGYSGDQRKNAALPWFHIPFGRKCPEELRTISPLYPYQFFILHCVSVHKLETTALKFVKIQKKLFLLLETLRSYCWAVCWQGRGVSEKCGSAQQQCLQIKQRQRWFVPLRGINCNNPPQACCASGDGHSSLMAACQEPSLTDAH